MRRKRPPWWVYGRYVPETYLDDVNEPLDAPAVGTCDRVARTAGTKLFDPTRNEEEWDDMIRKLRAGRVAVMARIVMKGR